MITHACGPEERGCRRPQIRCVHLDRCRVHAGRVRHSMVQDGSMPTHECHTVRTQPGLSQQNVNIDLRLADAECGAVRGSARITLIKKSLCIRHAQASEALCGLQRWAEWSPSSPDRVHCGRARTCLFQSTAAGSKPWWVRGRVIIMLRRKLPLRFGH